MLDVLRPGGPVIRVHVFVGHRRAPPRSVAARVFHLPGDGLLSSLLVLFCSLLFRAATAPIIDPILSVSSTVP